MIGFGRVFRSPGGVGNRSRHARDTLATRSRHARDTLATFPQLQTIPQVMGWAGPGQAGLGWARPGWAGPGQAGLGLAVLGWAGSIQQSQHWVS